MIMSAHIADVGPRRAAALLRRPLGPADSPGLRRGEASLPAPLGSGLPPLPRPGRVAFVAGWDDDEALDRFLDDHPGGRTLAGGWTVRLEPLRAVGAYSHFPDMPDSPLPVDDEEPVVVITYGRTKLHGLVRFLRANSPAAGLAADQPAMVAGTGLARPPRTVGTLSVWRTAREMREYATGAAGPGHRDAVRSQNERSFHHESLFARFRPYAAEGLWEGRNPLEGLAVPAGV